VAKFRQIHEASSLLSNTSTKAEIILGMQMSPLRTNKAR